MNSLPFKKIKKRYSSETALFVATLIWGGTFTIIKLSLVDISSMLFLGIRFFIASIIFYPFAHRTLKQLDTKQLYKGLILGFLLFLGFATQTIGLKYTTATKSGFITGSLVIFIPLFQIIIEKRKPSLNSVIGSLIVVCGLVLLSIKGTSFSNIFQEIGSEFNTGDFLSLLCALFYAMYIVYLDLFSKEINTNSLVFMQVSVTSLCAFITAFIFATTGYEAYYFHITSSLILSLIYTSLLATIITTYLQTNYQKNVTPTIAGIIFSFEPVFSAIIAYTFIGERIYGFGIAGCILIFGGLLFSELLNSNGE